MDYKKQQGPIIRFPQEPHFSFFFHSFFFIFYIVVDFIIEMEKDTLLVKSKENRRCYAHIR